MQQLRVILVEDDVLLREGLITLLSRFGHQVCAALGTTEELMAGVDTHRPDIVITDVRLPPSHTDEGIRAAREIRSTHPATGVLVLSQYVEHTYATEILEAGGGGVGYLLKDRVGDVRDFVHAVLNVADGGTVVDPEVVRQLLRRHRDPLARLTVREQEVLECVAAGRSNAAIARQLFVSEAAVAKHINSIFTKLDLPQAADDHRRVLAVIAYLQRPS